MQIRAIGFEGFRADYGNELRGELGEQFRFSLERPKKIRRQNSAAEISRQYSIELLANDAGIILRQIEASLALLL